MVEFPEPNDEENDDDENFEHHRVICDPKQTLIRIDKFLFDRIPNISRSKISNAAKNGNVLVNGEQVKQNYKVKPGDEISIVFPHPKRESELIAENIPLNIVYEDDDLVVVNKPVGMVVHPGYANFTGTLVNALLYHFENLPKNKKSEGAYPGLIHRIDKDTTGLLVIGKTEKALSNLALQFFNRTIDRRYFAIVWGDPEEDSGTIESYIARSKNDRRVMAAYEDGDTGKYAITHYKVLERLGYVAMVECKLDTGRTHQIRVHMKHIGHTLFGDERYGGNKILKGTTFTKYKQFVENNLKMLPRQALHAKTLAFTHPTTGKWMQFDSEIPEDMQQVMERWRNYSKTTGFTES